MTGVQPSRSPRRRCRFPRFPFVGQLTTLTRRTNSEVHVPYPSGYNATPLDPEAWARLSEDEQQAVYNAYKTINATPGVTPGNGLQPPETATTVRVQDGKAITTDGPFVDTKEALNGYLISTKLTTLMPRSSLLRRSPQLVSAARSRCAPSWSGNETRDGLPRGVGTSCRHPRQPPRQLRPSFCGGIRRQTWPSGPNDVVGTQELCGVTDTYAPGVPAE